MEEGRKGRREDRPAEGAQGSLDTSTTGEGTGGQRDPGGDRDTILGAPTLLHTCPQPRVHEAIPPSATVPESGRRTPRPRGQSPASALGRRGGGGGSGARGSGSGEPPHPPGTGGPRGVRAAGPAAGAARAGGRGQGARGGAAGRGSAGEMCERAARLCRAGAHRLLREPPPQGRALGGLLRWVGARMGEPRAPLVPDIPIADPGPGPAAPRGGTAVILDVSMRRTLRPARLGASP